MDATADPWSKNYKMYSYVTDELPATVFENFQQLDSSRVSITGHSMGGHGALSLFLKNPGKYKSVSAFAPISNPLKAPWGEKAFKGYFGEKDWESKGAEHDATELLKKWKGDPIDILIDVVSIQRKPYALSNPSSRVPATTFTSRSSSCQKISLKPPSPLARRRASTSDISQTMTIATSPWQALPTTMWTMLPSIFLHSTSQLHRVYNMDCGQVKEAG